MLFSFLLCYMTPKKSLMTPNESESSKTSVFNFFRVFSKLYNAIYCSRKPASATQAHPQVQVCPTNLQIQRQRDGTGNTSPVQGVVHTDTIV